jgi:hypothetical protein
VHHASLAELREKEREVHDEQTACSCENPCEFPLGLCRSAILLRKREQERTDDDRVDADRQHRVRGADDPHVEAVRVVPPVVEWRGRQHRAASPDANPCAERRSEPPEADSGISLGVSPEECRLECDVA